MIAIIDYDAGNIKSVEKALLSLGQEVTVTAKQDEILGADKIVLPGVGAFGDAMEKRKFRFWGYALDFRCCLNKAKKRRGWKDLGF